MSQSHTSLSLPARLLCTVGPPATILITGNFSYRAGLLTPLAYSPTALLYSAWRADVKKNGATSKRADLEPLVWTYAAASTLGVVGSTILQGIVCITASKLLFTTTETRRLFWFEFQRSTVAGLDPVTLSARSQLAGSWQNWAFNAALSFGAGFVEELMKFLPIVYARHRYAKKEKKQVPPPYLDYALAAALGFGLVEAIGFIYAAVESNETGLALSVTVAERFAGSIAHGLVASLTALRAMRQDREGAGRWSWLSAIAPAVLLHGTGDMIALSASSLEGNVGWIHPTGKWLATGMVGLITGVWGLTGWLVSHEVAQMN